MKIKNLCQTILAFSLFATPAAAHKNRFNKGGAQRGDARVDQVQAEKKKQDKDRDPILTTTRTAASTRVKPRASTTPRVIATKTVLQKSDQASAEGEPPELMVVSLLGEMRLENWEFRNHSYYHLPQSAGDFTSQASRLMAA